MGITNPIDARSSRRLKTRAKVMAACRARMIFGDMRPSIAQVARDANCSIRVIFDIYKSLDGMLDAALADAPTYDRLLCMLFETDTPPWTIGAATADRVLRAAVFGRIIEGRMTNG